MKKTMRKVIIAVLVLVFLGSTSVAIYQYFQREEAEEAYSEAEELVSLPDLEQIQPIPQKPIPEAPVPEGSEPVEEEEPEPVYVDPYADALRDMDFAALREVNTEVLGWILIPYTKVSYPIVQGEDNSYYLKRTWRKTRSDVGAIFVECQNSGDLLDFNTIIYGHRMNNRSMFGTLDYYKKADYLAEHPVIYITDDRGSHRYEIFAMYETPVDSITYRIGLTEDIQKQAYINWCLEQSVQDTGIVPTVDDRILTLSTCTGRGHATRWVVHAVLTGEMLTEEAKAALAEQAEAADTPTGDVQTEVTATTEQSVGEAVSETVGEATASAPEETRNDGEDAAA